MLLRRVVGIARLGHPFPSLLNALATLTISTLAGAPPIVAVRLAISMLSIQVSIGALNDYVDAARDAMEKPGKPIPAGAASSRAAVWVAVVGATAGIVLTLPSGGAPTATAAVALLLGYAYDLRLSRTPWSWLPLALALPLVPVHAWLGASGQLPPSFMALYPAAVAAGGALALANGLVDLERDARSERPTAAVALGASRAWAIHLVLVAVLATLSVALAPLGIWDRAGAQGTAIAASALRSIPALAVGLGLVALGLGALALRAHEPAVRERGWELEAVGVAVVGVGWLAGVATTTGA